MNILQEGVIIGFVIINHYLMTNYFRKLDFKMNQLKIIDEVLNTKIIKIERDIEKLENFRLKAYEKNLTMRESRDWDNYSSGDDINDLD